MTRSSSIAVLLSLIACAACSVAHAQRGIADKRSSFSEFIPMKADPSVEGLKPVTPYFRRANRAEIIRAIERACVNGRSGSSVYNEARHAGYYVNCNASNKQLLNGYIALNPKVEPHSR